MKLFSIFVMAAWLVGCRDETPIQLSKPFRTLQCSAFAMTLAWSSDGNWLACGDETGNVRLWESDNWGESTDLQKADAPILSLAWSGDDHYLAALSDDELLHVWETDSFKIILSLPVHINNAFTANGSRVIWSQDSTTVGVVPSTRGELLLIDVASRKPTFSYAIPDRTWVMPSPDLNYLAVRNADASVSVLDMKSEQPLLRFPANPRYSGGIVWLAWQRNSRLLAAATPDGWLQIWDMDDLAVPTFSTEVWGVRDLGWSPSGDVLFAQSGNHSILLWEAANEVQHTLTVSDEWTLYGITRSSDSEWIAGQSRTTTDYVLSGVTAFSRLYVWNAATYSLETTFTSQDAFDEVAWKPDDYIIASIRIGSSNAVRLWTLLPDFSSEQLGVPSDDD